HTEFDDDKFRKVVNDYRRNMVRRARELGIRREDRRELWDEVDSQVLSEIDNGEHRAMIAAYEFMHDIDGHGFQFEDLFEHNFERYTFHFTWACYAIARGIRQYDSAKEQTKEAA
ncbi:hypothetical protein PWG14_03715, partial (plasmid) [Chromobacterium amazonense]